MKKLIFLLLAYFLAIQTGNAQFGPLTPPQPVKKTPVIKSQTSPPLTATPTRPQSPPAPVYYLSSVKVNIGTGSDNKESLSNVSVEFWVRQTGYSIFAQNNLTNEMKKNSTSSIGLEMNNTYTSGTVPGSVPTIYKTTDAGNLRITLSDLKTYGMAVRVIYKPDFFMDAWKIENLSVTLEFRNAQGQPDAAAPTKNISFSNAATFLDNYDKRMLICTADQYFNSLTSFVTKDLSRLW